MKQARVKRHDFSDGAQRAWAWGPAGSPGRRPDRGGHGELLVSSAGIAGSEVCAVWVRLGKAWRSDAAVLRGTSGAREGLQGTRIGPKMWAAIVGGAGLCSGCGCGWMDVKENTTPERRNVVRTGSCGQGPGGRARGLRSWGLGGRTSVSVQGFEPQRQGLGLRSRVRLEV